MFRSSRLLNVVLRTLPVNQSLISSRNMVTINTRKPITYIFTPFSKALFSTTNNKDGENTNTEELKESKEEDGKVDNEEVISDTEIIASLEKEIHDLKEKVLRSLAEEENVRRIAKRDVENARTYANSSFAKAMLEVADDLERAMTVVSEDDKEKGDATLKALVEGIEMTDKNLQKTFKKFGVVQYGEVGQEFDPNIHDALFQIPDPTKPANTIGQVVKTGYKLHDRVIRAAQVGAVVAPPDN